MKIVLALMKRSLAAIGIYVFAVSLAGAADLPSADEIANKLSAKPLGGAKSRSMDPERGITNAAAGDEEPATIDLIINFEFNSAELTADGTVLVANLGRALNDTRLAGQKFLIEGHTDAVGSDAYNKGLSLRRAGRVRHELISRFGIPSSRIESTGFGESRLLDPDQPESEVNRRVRVVNLGNGRSKK
ncbi:MAG: OmpA family protein [Rhodospirillales bacterium]|nr:MAG: OmpA family protein [Rhodospirillales bacterium]